MISEKNMFNDLELSGKYLGTITKDFVQVADTLKEASYQVRARKFSQFPIFPMSKIEQPVGQLLIGIYETELELIWNYYISFLEEFVERKLVEDETVFKHFYKDPDEFCCLFVIDQTFTNLVFIPYPED
ncbi:MAG: hypothetical protein H7Y04_14670 [Verrucomicrobia bacterium]|nr:hypothetical protein [Cytophagales bacterium]